MSDLALGEMPFYWRLKNRVDRPNVVADRLPFSFSHDPRIGLLTQATDEKLLTSLRKIYSENYNIGYLQDHNELAKPYAIDWLRFLKESLAAEKDARTVLEIGCGGCVILKEISNWGYDVLGVDPSPIATEAARVKNLRVVPDFFPSPNVVTKVDFILHMDVLEHVSDPLEFLKQHRGSLNAGGLIAVSVPDSSENIELGDVSMAMHQHINYFDKESLARTFRAAGFVPVAIERAKYGGSLYGTARLASVVEASTADESFDASSFVTRCKHSRVAFQKVVLDAVAAGAKEIGLYCPLRAHPYLAGFDIPVPVRFFDDTAHWHRKMFDGTTIEIENREDFAARAPDFTIIMSLTFGSVIEAKLRDVCPDAKVTTLRKVITE